MKKAVIFDFDGTIIDTESAWFDIYQEILKEQHGFNLTLEEFVKVVGSTDGALFDFIDKSLDVPVDRTVFHDQVNTRFETIREQLALREGFLETVKQLKERGVLLAVASSSKRNWVEGFLAQYGLLEYFPIIVSAEDVDEVKPNPAIYEVTLERLGVTPDEAIAVEDSYNGSIAAISAGVHCLIIPNDVTRSLSFHEKGQLIESFCDFDYRLLEQ
ncbi:HAD family phosphatase [Sporosarcina sp. D27]|uniref:HAD family hydrolase n=1 Tax=Sporosarcina sp. D27 TaxID=1382305 RepID=UPI0004708FDA|nr:HAD-IA family hydrolase [Sporosarcina sp. D27]